MAAGGLRIGAWLTWWTQRETRAASLAGLVYLLAAVPNPYQTLGNRKVLIRRDFGKVRYPPETPVRVT